MTQLFSYQSINFINFSTTYFATSANGLFDFDLTIFAEMFIFLFLTIFITVLYLYPLSRQLEQRKNKTHGIKQKAAILLSARSENVLNIFEMFIREAKESRREIKKNLRVFFPFEQINQGKNKYLPLIQELSFSSILYSVYFSSKIICKSSWLLFIYEFTNQYKSFRNEFT